MKRPDREANPKAAMNNHFMAARGTRYEDRVHAIKVLKATVLDWKRLQQSASFARFERKL